MERIWNELKKMSEGKHFDKAIIELHHFGLLQTIFPLLKNTTDKEIHSYVSVFHKFPAHCPTILYLMELFPHETPESRQDICLFLKTSAKDMQLVALLDDSKKMVESPHDLVEWAYFYADPRSEFIIPIIGARKDHDFLQHHHHQQMKLRKHIERIKNKTPLIGSKHLQNEGIAPGKQMGLLIQEGERITISQDLHDPKEVIAQLKQTTLWQS
jgi:poly(A) polymerase